MGICVLRSLKEELVSATDKWLQAVSNIVVFKTVIPLMELKNKAVLSSKQLYA